MHCPRTAPAAGNATTTWPPHPLLLLPSPKSCITLHQKFLPAARSPPPLISVYQFQSSLLQKLHGEDQSPSGVAVVVAYSTARVVPPYTNLSSSFFRVRAIYMLLYLYMPHLFTPDAYSFSVRILVQPSVDYCCSFCHVGIRQNAP
jgi:hypothetical protein